MTETNTRSGPLQSVIRYLRRVDGQSSSDRHLLERYASHHDEEAFALLVRRYGSLVQGVCRRILQHTQDAEDATQAAFLILARKAAAIAWGESIAGWLHEVAVRVALEARGKLARRLAREQNGVPLEEPPMPPPARNDLADVLDEELSRLPDQLRAPLVLCYLEGKTRDEVAEQLASTGQEGELHLWDPATGAARHKLFGHRAHVSAVAFSGDGTRLVTAEFAATLRSKFTARSDDDTIRIWDTATYRQLVAIPAPLTHTVVFSADAMLVYYGDQKGNIHCWDARTGQLKCTLAGHTDAVFSLAPTADGRRLASSSEDGTIRIWNLTNEP